MRNPLQRRYGKGDLHFVTFSCSGRRPLLGTPQARDCFVAILAEVRIKYSFRLIGYVVMPEHVHLLIAEPGKGNPSKVLQVLKQRVSRTLHEQRLDGDHSAEQHFWQRRFYDFTGAGSTWSPPEKRVDWREAYGKAGVHAHEPGEEKTCVASEGLAME